MSAGPNNDDWVWVANPDHYILHEIGDSTFAFSRVSGTTHMLNLVSRAMLDYLAEHPKTLTQIIAGFAAYLEVPPEECPSGVVRRLFGELDEVGLVERVEP
ncbi:HPr-rel-A system PqqD family peptide chaperone [Kordiimonas lacus]|uniref:PqqD family protein, HPr-rel-A system n=1 Tax=Kordiimonas lacus TaxID=637679 RepID=A0A1G6W352_9PROT|nr:HPr-rel-A system PqqD family peptide chaperone [Kordiimonas lacus]SDD60218.1 PqqD family protein, HPr-rel-A system [Kordiimonas lacus]